LRQRLNGRPFSIRVVPLLIVCALVTWGCQSAPKTGSSWLASVILHGKTVSQIRITTIDVFQKEAYELRSAEGNELVLEKRGSTMSSVLYGDWSGGVWTRVKLRIRDYGPDARLLECNAYRVRGRGDAVFEEEQKLSSMKSGPYQKLLDEVKQRLD
jgi:hypothetical protein